MTCVRIYFVVFCYFFFFKQKTAYEMRISDWSSDVCSSDLHAQRGGDIGLAARARAVEDDVDVRNLVRMGEHVAVRLADPVDRAAPGAAIAGGAIVGGGILMEHAVAQRHVEPVDAARSEEHTSELQSLMRISYAVFCLKTKQQLP